jgi:hypothetical protein
MNPEIEAADAMRACGITPPNHIIFDGRIRRFGRKKSGWCVFFDGQVKAGAFGDWKLGITEKFIESRQTLTPMDRKRIGQVMRDAAAQRERELKAKYEQAAKDCTAIWEGADHE